MKTKVWKDLTWDLRIVYNKISQEYIVQIWDYHWENYKSSKTIKKAIKNKHSIIKRRAKRDGLFNKEI